jgi:phosphoglycolate phosphatase
MPASPRAVIFDLDGTLIDSAPDLLEALNHVLAQQGRRRADLHEVHMMMGHGAVHLLDKGLAATGGVPPEGVHEALVESFLEYYEAHIAVHTRPFPGVVETLAILRDTGYKMAVCTNKMQHFADKVLDALELGAFFETVVGGGATGFYKPDPKHLGAVLEKMVLQPHESVMVGDSINDVAAAQALNMPVAVVTYGYSPEAVCGLGADMVLESFDALPAALGELAAAT